MLRVEGVEVEERRGNGDREEEDEEEEGVETLVERFARRMGELRRVVEGVRRGGSLGATDYKGEGEGE